MPLASDERGAPVQAFRYGKTIPRTLTTASALADAFTTGVRMVRLMTDQACHINLRGDADTSDTPLPANAIEYVRVRSGDRIRARSMAGTGTLWITELE